MAEHAWLGFIMSEKSSDVFITSLVSHKRISPSSGDLVIYRRASNTWKQQEQWKRTSRGAEHSESHPLSCNWDQYCDWTQGDPLCPQGQSLPGGFLLTQIMGPGGSIKLQRGEDYSGSCRGIRGMVIGFNEAVPILDHFPSFTLISHAHMWFFFKVLALHY